MDNDEIVANLSSSAYTLVNDNLLRGLGGDAYQAIILAKLLSFFNYFFTTKQLTPDGYFYQTVDDIERMCGITECRQRTAIRELEIKNLVSIRISGSPPRRYFRLHTNNITALMELPNKKFTGMTKAEMKELQDKFYAELNPALVFSWKLTKERGGNIPRRLLWFMFVWQDYMKTRGGFVWTPALYGELRTYWRGRYNVKNMDYNNLNRFMIESPVPKTIYNFITFDRTTPEAPYDNRLYYNEMEIEGERYEE